jgi:hypothetical protein
VPGRSHGLGLVVDQDVDHAIRMLHAGGADFPGMKTPRPPPSIMAGPPMPILLLRVAMITSLQPNNAALPAKQRPWVMPTTGT